jgi:hypothetical protein
VPYCTACGYMTWWRWSVCWLRNSRDCSHHNHNRSHYQRKDSTTHILSPPFPFSKGGTRQPTRLVIWTLMAFGAFFFTL